MRDDNVKPLVSLVIPVYNEGTAITSLLRQIEPELDALEARYLFEVIFVNDGSTDETYERILALTRHKPYIKLLDLSRNFGNQIAVSAGVNEARGDAVITMDGDLQQPPALIPELLAEWEKGSEVVQAKRVEYHPPGFLKSTLSALFFYLIERVSDVTLEKDISDFRLMDKKVREYFKKVTERQRFVRGIINWMGFRKSYVEYHVPTRISGTTSFSFSRLFHLAMTGLTSFSRFPLKIASILGAVITIFSFGLLVVMTYTYLSGNIFKVRPIAFLAVLNALMGGLILICLGFISLYIGNIHEEVRHRPLYIVRERINFDNNDTDH